MNVVHAIPFIGEEASGPAYSVPRLCRGLAERGCNTELVCMAPAPVVPGVDVTRYRRWPLLHRFGISPGLARAVADRASTAEVVHNHGLWSMVNVTTGWTVPQRRARLVVSPRGTLSSWALRHSRGKKRMLWPLQKRLLTSADLFHATSVAELEDIRRLGLTAPVAVIPNGVDVPAAVPQRAQSDLRTCLFLGRLHPTKGLERLLRCWAELEPFHTDWRLVIAGKGDAAYEARIRAQASDHGLRRVSFAGALYGEAKSKAYGQADLFVLPTESENFGMAVAEALAHGCPAVVSREAPWSGLTNERCGWWVELSDASFTHAMGEAMSLSDADRIEIGRNGQRWMKRDYAWDAIAGAMVESYRWLIGGGAVPGVVHVQARRRGVPG